MGEGEIRVAIWNMLCNYDKEEIKEAFSSVDIDSLIDEVEIEVNEED